MSFVELLSLADRRRLREVVRRVHLNFLPQHMISTYECDKLIDSFAPDAVEHWLRVARGDEVG